MTLYIAVTPDHLELPWRGSRNQRLIDVQQSLRQGKAVEYGGAPQ